eukprot:9879164-Alexandrium_andersonii.AAC.1
MAAGGHGAVRSVSAPTQPVRSPHQVQFLNPYQDPPGEERTMAGKAKYAAEMLVATVNLSGIMKP